MPPDYSFLDTGPPWVDPNTGNVVWIKPEINIGPITTLPARWCPGTCYGKGERILGSHNRWMIAECTGFTNYGTVGIDEPHWPEMEGCTVLDGTVVWKCEGFPGMQPAWAKALAADWAAHLATGYYLSPDDQPIFDMKGNPISQSTQAREATPKFEPPLWEEREV